MLMPNSMTTVLPNESLNERVRRVIDLHFHPTDGSAYWLDRAAALGIDPLREIHNLNDLALLGDMTPKDLQAKPLMDYVPRWLHRERDLLTVCQTGGTTGGQTFGTWTAYRDDEFDEAFIQPFVAAAGHVGFPARVPWLFVGPSGPHAIGKVVRDLAASLGSAEPFAVDFDPRWARRLPEGSFARERYLTHVVEQAMAVIATQDVRVLFSTPPVLEALAGTMSESQRRRIGGVHHGGLAITPGRMARFQTELFPEAVHLSGYGNTLLGCSLELDVSPHRQIDYFPWGNRLVFEVFGEDGQPVPAGGVGRVRVTRLDETMLIVRLTERDVAELLPAPPPGSPPGFQLPGLRNPGPPQADAAKVAGGLY
jgi:thienamycin biosynthesis protein ThnN